MKRPLVLLGSILIQTCLGGVYAWSAFVSPLMDEGLTGFQTQVIFGITIAAFAVSMLPAGRLQVKRGPRLVAVLGGILFGGGYLIASLSGGSFIGLLLGIGILSGAGIGLGYVCPLVTCVKWFPRHKGLITGVSVAGFGAGAALLEFWIGKMLAADIHILVMFRRIGMVYGAILIGAAGLLFLPEKTGESIGVEPIPFGEFVSNRRFWSLVLGIFAGTFGGLLVIGNLKPIAIRAELNPAIVGTAIGSLALGNAIGRVIWGRVYDWKGSGSIPVSLVLLAFSIVALAGGNGLTVLFPVFCILIGMGFGGCFVLYAAQVTRIFGVHGIGYVYPWVFLAYGLSALIGPPVGGWLADRTGCYTSSIVLGTTIPILGALAFGLMERIKISTPAPVIEME